MKVFKLNLSREVIKLNLTAKGKMRVIIQLDIWLVKIMHKVSKFLHHLIIINEYIITVIVGQNMRLRLIHSNLGAVYSTIHWFVGSLAKILLIPPALYVSYILISDGTTLRSKLIYKEKTIPLNT